MPVGVFPHFCRYTSPYLAVAVQVFRGLILVKVFHRCRLPALPCLAVAVQVFQCSALVRVFHHFCQPRLPYLRLAVILLRIIDKRLIDEYVNVPFQVRCATATVYDSVNS